MAINKITTNNTTLLDLTGDDLTSDTSKVANGMKYHGRDGNQYTGTFSGGTQPTLYPPIITGGVNEVSWANNTSNGDFAVTLTADVNGTPVTSPLTITEQMDGQILTITASATNFQSATTTIELTYMAGDSLISITGWTTTSNVGAYISFPQFSSGNVTNLKAHYGTSDIVSDNSGKYYFPISIINGNNNIALKFIATSACTLTKMEIGIGIEPTIIGEWSSVSGIQANPFASNWAMSIYVNGNLIADNTKTSSTYYISNTFSQALSVGDEITFIVNVSV